MTLDLPGSSGFLLMAPIFWDHRRQGAFAALLRAKLGLLLACRQGGRDHMDIVMAITRLD